MVKILVTGGSGYLGQFLVKHLCSSGDHTVAFTFHSRALSDFELEILGNPLAFRVDLKTGEGLQKVYEALGMPDIIINCAAISVPRECEKNPELAFAINVPKAVTEWVKSQRESTQPFLIHLSTDQVYEGSKSFYKEEDAPLPVNKYGESKVDAELYIQTSWSNFVILWSSIIVGPKPPVDIPKGLPLQWIDGVLASGKETDFFGDEFRCPIFVFDFLKVIEILISSSSEGKQFRETFNFGGPDRLSRAEMAETVALLRGHDRSLVKVVPASSVNRGVASPPDISMDVTHVTTTLGITLTSFKKAVEDTFGL